MALNFIHLLKLGRWLVGQERFLLAFHQWERFETIVKFIIYLLLIGSMAHTLQGATDRQFVRRTITISAHHFKSISYYLISVVVAVDVSELRRRAVLWQLVILDPCLKTHQSLQILLLLNLDFEFLLFENHLLDRKHILGLISKFLPLVLRVVPLGVQRIFNVVKSFFFFLDF